MNVQRAAEIAASPIMEHVTHDGVPIYIQHVNEENGMARIYPLGQPDQEQEVPVRSLSEASSAMAMEGASMHCPVPDGE